MNIQQLQYVLAVAEFRHFETAAQKCHISQSTLSTMISKLEDELEIVIFDRRKKPVDITRDGHTIIGQLKIITSEIGRLEELVKELKGEISGTISIACIPTVAPFLLPAVIPDFSKQYPKAELEVKENTTEEIIRQLKSGELDIGIISTPSNDDELLEFPLYQEPFVYYDKSGRTAQNISLNDITYENFWLMAEGHCFRDQVLKICGAGKKKINKSNLQFKAGSIGSLVRFVNASNGKTLLPYTATIHLSPEERDCISLFKNPVPQRTVGMVTHHHFAKKKMLELLKEVIQKNIISTGKPLKLR